ncbi:MAG: hypothetical protein HN886_10870 [Woeseiaceae bacterium]|jgi:hypothetical protein|nr:hypothetical protein [Woeseiaceae bacterium]|tara:strand:+ start:231 stop:710 length:480 start_codon:yes stop_codon:yes gene_type:complete
MTKLPVTISFTGVTNLLGIIGIIGSLVFVGMELRQSQQIALAAQQQQRAALITEVIGTFSDANPPISFLDFLNQTIDMDDKNNRATTETYMYRVWMIYENDHLQHKLGLMDEDVWQAKLTSMRAIYGMCQYKEVTRFALSYSSQDLRETLQGSGPNPCP